MKQKRARQDDDDKEERRSDKKKREDIFRPSEQADISWRHSIVGSSATWEFVATDRAHLSLFQRLVQLEEPARSPFLEWFPIHLKLVSGWTGCVVQESKSLPFDVIADSLKKLEELQDSVRLPPAVRQMVWHEAFQAQRWPFLPNLTETKVLLSREDDRDVHTPFFFCSVSMWIRSWISAYYCRALDHDSHLRLAGTPLRLPLETEQATRLARAICTQQLTCNELHSAAATKAHASLPVFRACVLAWHDLLRGRDQDQGLSHALLSDAVARAAEQIQVLRPDGKKDKESTFHVPPSVCTTEVFWSVSDLLSDLCQEGRWADALVIQHRYKDVCPIDHAVAIKLGAALSRHRARLLPPFVFMYPLHESSVVLIGSPSSMAVMLLNHWVASKTADPLCLLRLFRLARGREALQSERLLQAIVKIRFDNCLDSKRQVDACVKMARTLLTESQQYAAFALSLFGPILRNEVPWVADAPTLLSRAQGSISSSRLETRLAAILVALIQEGPQDDSDKLAWLCSVAVACKAIGKPRTTIGTSFLCIQNVLPERTLSLSQPTTDCLVDSITWQCCKKRSSHLWKHDQYLPHLRAALDHGSVCKLCRNQEEAAESYDPDDGD